MQQFALYLHGAAVGIGAEPLGFVFLAHEGSAAVGADGGELRPRGAGLALGRLHCRYFGDDLAALLHIHPVAFVDVQGGHLVGIDQGGALDHGAAELYRLQVCHRSNGPGAAYLVVDGQDGGEGLLGLELVCYRPAGHLGREAQGALERHFVDLDDYSVGGEGEELALGVPVVDVFLDFAYAVHDLAFVRHRQPPAFSGCESLVVAAEFQAALGRDVVEGAHEAAAGHFLAVQQLQRTRRGVAGVGERRLAGIVALAVQGVEGGVGHQHLAPDLEVGREIALERVGDIGDASGVFGDVVALYAVAAGEGTVELAVTVGEADGGAVELELAAVREARFEGFLGAGGEFLHLGDGVGIGKGEHGIAVGPLYETLLKVAAHALGGGVGGFEFRPFGLQMLQLVHEGVELVVRHGGGVIHIITPAVLPQESNQFLDSCLCRASFHTNYKNSKKSLQKR